MMSLDFVGFLSFDVAKVRVFCDLLQIFISEKRMVDATGAFICDKMRSPQPILSQKAFFGGTIT